MWFEWRESMSIELEQRFAWNRGVLSLIAVCSLLLSANVCWGQTKFTASQIEFFERSVRPLLAARCYKCHSGKAKSLKGGLRLDSRAALLTGGDSGPAISPGKPDASLLIKAIRYQTSEMPPTGKLKAAEIAVLVKWVRLRAPWPVEKKTTVNPPSIKPRSYDWAKLRNEHWAFRAVRKPPLPTVKDSRWPQVEFDRFVLAKLERNGLRPAPPAKANVLIRRLYLDLIGLPPSPRDVEQFEQAFAKDRQKAVNSVIDRLLSSRHYGERWGRHWLDVARYSDGFGGFLDNKPLANAWRYRDWVVAAFNKDLPFDQFVKLQIAGDLMGDRSQAVATGFFALGPTYRSDGGDPDSKAQAMGETLDDRVDTLTRGFLALTVSCARCHDHKFDPVPQIDYYSLAGIFRNTKLTDIPLADAATVKAYNDHQKRIRDVQQRINRLRNTAKKQKRKLTPAERKDEQKGTAELNALRKTAPKKYGVAHGLAEAGNRDMRIALRGNLRKPGPPAPRRFLRILAGANGRKFTKGSGRRELADAVADARNPLTARVIVNRIWMHHFGQPLVGSPGNFGKVGEKPTHPKLLDWLATRFVESGWSIKKLHRLILRSATWQMSSRFDRKSDRIDSGNRLLWRMNPRRLDVEAWRDSVLSVTGELDRQFGGPPTDDLRSKRRTLYFKVSRNGDRFASDIFLRLFDFPLMRATVSQRPKSIVPQQYLFLMNSPFMKERAKMLATRLIPAGKTNRQRIDFAYRLLYARPPTAAERRLGIAFLSGATESSKPGENIATSLWRQYAQVLLSANEFIQIR